MERKEILAKADELGIAYQKNIKTDALLEKIEAFERGEEVEMKTEPTAQKDVISREELEAQIRAEYEAKLKEELANELERRSENQEINAVGQSPYKPAGKSKAQKIKDSMKLVRCIVTNRNPMKQGWDGEIIAVANDLGVNARKFVPFGIDQGYHLPQIMINALNDKKCTIFVKKKGPDGKLISRAKQIKEYAIEILPPLTKEELKELAADQRARGAIDD